MEPRNTSTDGACKYPQWLLRFETIIEKKYSLVREKG